MKSIYALIIVMIMLLILTACSTGSAPLRADPPHVHKYASEVMQNATCTEGGTKMYTCSCGYTYSEKISATGHSYTVTNRKKMTCTEDGFTEYTCNCGDTYTSKNRAFGHSYTIRNSKEVTCFEDGFTEYICNCGDTYTETAPAAHAWNNATCTLPKTCSRCGETADRALSHNISNGICSQCGEKIAVVLYEDPSIIITFKEIKKYKYSDDEVSLYFYVENKTDNTLMIQADAVSLNGYSFCNLTMSDRVAAQSIGTIDLTIHDFIIDLVNINAITNIGGQFRIIDDVTNDTYDAVFVNVNLDGTGKGTKPADFNNSNLLYSDDHCSIYYKSIREYPYSYGGAELFLMIENKTAKTIVIQGDVISINGHSYSDLTMSDPVLSNTIGIVNLLVHDFDFSLIDIHNISKIGGQLRIIDDASNHTYKVIFTNIDIP